MSPPKVTLIASDWNMVAVEDPHERSAISDSDPFTLFPLLESRLICFNIVSEDIFKTFCRPTLSILSSVFAKSSGEVILFVATPSSMAEDFVSKDYDGKLAVNSGAIHTGIFCVVLLLKFTLLRSLYVYFF